MAEVYLGIDPGSSKTGLALTRGDGRIMRLKVIAGNNMEEAIRNFVQGEQPAQVIIGDGTTSKAARAAAERVFDPALLVSIDESHSTEEARTLYWQENPARGWRRCLPLGLLVPPEPLDAYAAVILVRRFLRSQTNGANHG